MIFTRFYFFDVWREPDRETNIADILLMDHYLTIIDLVIVYVTIVKCRK